jgi:hypothetical protein
MFGPAAVLLSTGLAGPAAHAAAAATTVSWCSLNEGSNVTFYAQQESTTICDEGSPPLWGFASMTTNANGSHFIEVCYKNASDFAMQVNAANPDGSASTTVITYEDNQIGKCFEETLGYPIRKFIAEFTQEPGGGVDGSPFWQAPAPRP